MNRRVQLQLRDSQMRLSRRPSAVTHAGGRALMSSKRNKTDEVIRSLAEKGGYFGVFNYGFWLTSRPDVSVDIAADHVEHVVKVGGIDLVGSGSDHGLYRSRLPTAQARRPGHLALPGSGPVAAVSPKRGP